MPHRQAARAGCPPAHSSTVRPVEIAESLGVSHQRSGSIAGSPVGGELQGRGGFYSGSSATGFTAKSVLPQFGHGSSLRSVSIRSPRVSKNSWASVTPPRDLRYSASASVSCRYSRNRSVTSLAGFPELRSSARRSFSVCLVMIACISAKAACGSLAASPPMRFVSAAWAAFASRARLAVSAVPSIPPRRRFALCLSVVMPSIVTGTSDAVRNSRQSEVRPLNLSRSSR
jgi:hypothetical protein